MRDARCRSGLAAWHDRRAAPFAWIDITHRLGEHPLVAERVDHAALPLPVGHVLASGRGVGAAPPGSFERRVNIIDSKHNLVRRANTAFIVAELAHNHLSTLPVDTELHTMGLANTDMLYQPEHLDVERNRFVDVGHGEDRDHPRPRR